MTAALSRNGKYRYLLQRGGEHKIGWVLLNPSTVDAADEDQTTRKLAGFTRDLGYDGFALANVYAYRTPYPDALFYDGAGDIVGPLNDHYLRAVATLPLVIVAWGKHADAARVQKVTEVLSISGRPLWCLKRNINGSPQHPLYVPYGTRLLEWQP